MPRRRGFHREPNQATADRTLLDRNVRPGSVERRGHVETRLPRPLLLSYSHRGEGSIRMPRIKQLLSEGKVVRVFGLGQLISPKLIEILGEHGGFDALWLDFEPTPASPMKEIELATMAARGYGMDHFVRLPATDYASVMRPLEAGAGGLMFSMIRSPADAEQAVRWAKFWPRGERGLNGGNRDGRFGLTPLAEYTARANAETFVGVQIETAGALASLKDIATMIRADIDLLFVGPSTI